MNVGTNSNTFSTSTLANGDVVHCILTSNAACALTTVATSNNITMSVTSVVPPTVSITASSTSVCAGAPVTFTATVTNPGTSPYYQWKLNGTTVGTNSNIFTSNVLLNGDAVTCEFTSSSTCFTTTTAIALPIVMSVFPVPVISPQPDITILPNGQSYLGVNVSGGSKFSYLWTPANYLNNDTLAKPLARPVTTTLFNVVVKNEGGCAVSGVVRLVVKAFVAISAFSPNGDGINDTWQVADLSSYPGAVVEVYNRRGAVVFRTNNNTPWDGKINGQLAPVGTYYYVVNTKIAGQKPLTGWVQLLR
jgi:gliding motility-associated-like protein